MTLDKTYPDPSFDGMPVKRNKFSAVEPRIIYYALLLLSGVLYFSYIELAHDYEDYTSLFYRLQKYDFSEIFVRERYEPLFITLSWLLANILEPKQIYYLIAIFILIAKYYIWNRYSEDRNKLYFMLVYFPLFAFIIDANQIRSGIASIFLFYLVLALPSSRTIIISAVLATLLHYSGIICFFALLRQKSLKKILLTLVALVIVSLFLLYITNLNLSNFAMYLISTGSENIELISIVSVSYLFIAFLVVSRWKNLHEARRTGAIYILVGITFYYLPLPAITAHRIAELSLLGIMPFLATFSKNNSFDIAMLLPIGVIVIYYCVYLLGRTGLL